MSTFDRLGNDMSDDIAEALEHEADVADRKYASDINVLIAAVRKHAEENYNTGGWDFVVECWEDTDIAEVLTEGEMATTEAEAIRRVGEVVEVSDDRRTDIMAEGDRESPEEVAKAWMEDRDLPVARCDEEAHVIPPFEQRCAGDYRNPQCETKEEFDIPF